MKEHLAIEQAAASSRTTNGAAEAVDACRYYAGLIVGALQGRSKDDLLAPLFTPLEGLWGDQPLAPAIAEVASGSFRTRNPPEIEGFGYVVKSMEAALWAFARSDTFEEGALLAVNLGRDADTTGAIYGQLAGAYHGVAAIPPGWREKLASHDLLERCADQLAGCADVP